MMERFTRRGRVRDDDNHDSDTNSGTNRNIGNNTASGLLGATGNLRLAGVEKAFGDVVVVHALDLEVPRGSFFALLGPSGSGKTTTLRMIAGLEQPTAGRVLVGDAELTGSRPYQRPVNTVFQSYALFPHLTVRRNVAFGPQRRKQADALALADDALRLVQMQHLADRKPAQLSGGQQQRVALARALVNRPEVLLLDEPLGALDLKLRRQMQVELKRIQTEVGLTFVHVTHDQEEAMSMADTVAVMNAGRIEQLGPPAKLYDLPRTVFVANFLGQSNLVSGTAQESGDQVRFSAPGVQVEVPRDRAAVRNGPCVRGVRPEKVEMLTPEESVGDRASVEAIVLDGSFVGVATHYLLDGPGDQPWTVFEQNLRSRQFADGDRVRLAFDPAHAFLVPPAADLTEGSDQDAPDLGIDDRT